MYSGLNNPLKTNQVIEHILSLVKNGTLPLNAQAPSINKIAVDLNVANETVVKAYRKLKENGIIRSVRGKGFFLASTDLSYDHRIVVLFDTFTAYKETLYNGMLERFGVNINLDIHFHHYNLRAFENLIKECNGKYTEYIILPYFNADIIPLLEQLPHEKLYLLDGWIRNYPCKGIYQDFGNDIYETLRTITNVTQKYRRFQFVYRHDIMHQVITDIHKGLVRYCKEMGLPFTDNKGIGCPSMEKGDAFLVIDDEYLVELVLQAENKHLILGRDVGIISYNETSLKKIAAGGISVISTDFRRMGYDIADMILTGNGEQLSNPCLFIDRSSF